MLCPLTYWFARNRKSAFRVSTFDPIWVSKKITENNWTKISEKSKNKTSLPVYYESLMPNNVTLGFAFTKFTKKITEYIV